jgi:GT2 family glycosyltransferase
MTGPASTPSPVPADSATSATSGVSPTTPRPEASTGAGPPAWSPAPAISVVIPTLGRAEILRDTLDSLLACDPPPAEILVVDGDPDGSAAPVVAAADNRSGCVRRYLTSAPGSTVQRNVGLDAAIGDVIAFLDDDVTVGPDFFAELADVYAAPDVVGATGLVIEPRSHRLGDQRSRLRRWLPGGGGEGRFTRFGYPRYLRDLDRPCDVETMQGCLMTARRGAAARVRFDESLTGYAIAEDEDFSYRLSRIGRIRYVPTLVLHHLKLGFGTRDPRALNRVAVVNRAYLFRKNFRQTPLARLQFGLLMLILVIHRVANRNWPGLRGLLDGLREARRDPRARRAAAPDAAARTG